MSPLAATGTGIGLLRLRELLAQGGGLLAGLLADPPTEVSASAPAALAAAGPRTEGRTEEYELLVEAIYEGYLLHYGQARLLREPEADLCVLAGDRLYAIGLARLVELRDTPAVAELADTISLSSLAQGAGEPDLADAVWRAGALAVGWGSSAEHRRAKQLLLDGDPAALDAMRTSSEGSPSSRAAAARLPKPRR